ncbi:MAG: intradiol ring-cleavage dioxygenase [Actinobacteria bacterium]|nr:MAG: intradiol ring-cleavage dioxygenase [Actinomycetota bacterium]
MNDEVRPIDRVTIDRRTGLRWLGAVGLVAVAAACGGDSSSSATRSTRRVSPTRASSSNPAASGANACVLSPEMTEGPFYLDTEKVRADITEGKPGKPIALVLNVVDAATCAPIANAAVDVWHADAEGVYSGFGAAASRSTFLRGIQMTDANGTSQFATIYPGWYRGRAVHIHVKVHRGGSVVHTGQLFFDETVTEAVYATSPYNARRGTWLRNRQDSIYADGGAQSLLALTPDGNGYRGALTLGVRAS